jgi:hypothetical protein
MIAPLYICQDGTPVYYAEPGCDSCGAGLPSSQCCAPSTGEYAETLED